MSEALRPERASTILRLAVPIMFSFWFRSAFQWVDTVFASTLEADSDASIAAIGMTVPFEFLMIACWVGTSNGLTARFSAAMGASEGAKMAQLVRSTRRIILALNGAFLLLAAALWFGAELYLGSERPELVRQFRIYATVLIGGSAFTSFWSILPDSIVKAHHDTKSTMWAGILSTVTNGALNAYFLFVLHWGIFGIALSTVLGRIVSLVYAMQRARSHERGRLERDRDREPGVFERPTLAILAIAVPAALTFALMALESQAILWLLLRTGSSTAAVAAWSLYDQALRFLSMPIIALGVAMLPLAARLWGARDTGGIRREMRIAQVATLVYVVAFVVPLVAVGGRPFVDWLADEAETRDFARTGLLFVPFAVLAMGPLFVLRSAFDGMQNPRPGLLVSFVRTVVLVVPLCWLGLRVAPELGLESLTGAFAGFVVGVGTASLLLERLFRRELRAAPAGGGINGSLRAPGPARARTPRRGARG